MATDNSRISLREALYQYAEESWKLFPVNRLKKPLTEHGFKDATQTKDGIDDYLRRYPGANWAGWFDNQLIIDIDPQHGGSLEALEAKHGKLPRTRTHRTGGGGTHSIFRQPPGYDIRNTVALSELKGIDRRGNGGYIVLPPSFHESGSRYEVIDDSPIAEAPNALLQTGTSEKPLVSPAVPGRKIPFGERNHYLFRRACGYRNKGDGEEAIFYKVKVDYALVCEHDPPLSEKELHDIAGSAKRYAPASPRTPRCIGGHSYEQHRNR